MIKKHGSAVITQKHLNQTKSGAQKTDDGTIGGSTKQETKVSSSHLSSISGIAR